MGMIPRSFIDDLLARVDLVELINASVPLKRSGKNYMACCPFHKEKTPSFSVSPEGQFYHCFGCGQSGNAISFLMDYQRMEFVESIEHLAGRMGMEVPRESGGEKPQARQQYQALYELLDKANQYYQQQLRQAPDKERAVNYLKGRGLSGAIAKQFQIGYAPPGWNNLITSEALKAFTAKQLVEAGLSIAKNEYGNEDRSLQYDRFRDRIIFPIRDSRGRCIAFGGRVLGKELPKYLNSPETPVFNKSRELYGLYEARQANRRLNSVLVVEGYMDVIALAQAGINNAVATMGTSLGSDHLHTLFRFVKDITFCFDGDKAGRQAAERALHNALPFLEDGRHIRFLFLEEGEDPDTMVRKQGKAHFEGLIKSARPISEFIFDYASQGLDLGSLDGRASLANNVAPLIQQMPKGLFYEMMIKRLGDITQLDSNTIRQSLQQHSAKQPIKANPAKVAAPASPTPSPASHNSDSPPLEAYEQLAYHSDDQWAEDAADDMAYMSEQLPEPRISTVNRILGYLLKYPALAFSCDIPEEVYKLRVHNIDLLIELINYIKSADSARINTAMILGHWHNTAEGFLLGSLAHSEIMLDKEAWEAEYKDALQRLIQQFFTQELSKIKGNSEEDKARYKQLLADRKRFENPDSSNT